MTMTVKKMKMVTRKVATTISEQLIDLIFTKNL